MKTLKIFIASSEELKLERLALNSLIIRMNKVLKKHDIRLEPEMWEMLDASMGPLHKQEEYNLALRTCDVCLVLFWNRFGDFTAEEFNVAYEATRNGGMPRHLYVVFKRSNNMAAELNTFQNSLSQSYNQASNTVGTTEELCRLFARQMSELLQIGEIALVK